MSEHIDRLSLEAWAEELAPAARRQAVEAHIAECQVCRAHLASARQMSALLRRLPREAPAPYLATRLNAAIAAGRAPAGWAAERSLSLDESDATGQRMTCS